MKKIITLGVLVHVCACLMGQVDQECNVEYNAEHLDKDLLIYLPFDGDGADASQHMTQGYINNGTLPTNDRKEDAAKAMEFGLENEITYPGQERYEINYPFTFSFWAYFETSGTTREGAIVATDFTENNYSGIFVARRSDGRISCVVGNAGGFAGSGNGRSMSSAEPLVEKEWIHIVLNLKGPENGCIFINGCEVPTIYQGDGTWNINYLDGPFKMGRCDTSNGIDDNNFLIGKLDDFYFWNRTITEEEILYLYDRYQVPSIGLLDSYDLCESDQVFIEVDPVFENVTWSDGFEGNERLISEAGSYMLEGFYNCHLVCHEFEVIEVPIEISLGDDITTCEDQVTLSTSVIADWNTGEISNSIIVNQSGVYIANYQSACGSLNDTIVVDLLSNHSISLEETYEFCLGSSVLLSIDSGYESVLWSDGTIGNSIEIFEPGVYQVLGEETFCPADSQLFTVLVQDTILEIEINDSIFLCDEESTIINAPSGDYQTIWNGVQEGSSFIAEGEQDVQLTLSNECDEDQYIINVKSVLSEPIELLEIAICQGDSILISGPIGAEQYNWSTTDTTSSVLITEEGDYSLTYSNEGCVFEAEVASIEVNSCIDCKYYIPNIISTRSTVGNDEFLVKSNHEECLNDITVTIYDRWGGKMFDAPADTPWDGLFNDKQVTSGVFVVRLTGVFEGASVNITADLTVVH